MTIQSETHRNDYVGAGSTDTFSYGYKIFAAADLVVVERDTDDVETTLVLDTDYTVTGVGETVGGTIVLTAGNLTLDYALAIVRRRALKQETDLRNQGDFNPEQLEDAYDNIVMQTQTLQEQVDRSLLLPESLTGVSNLLPVPAASKYLRLNAAGTAFEFVTLTSSVVGTIAVQDADSVAITGGAINNTSIGGVTPSPATVTTLAVDSTLAVSGAVTFGSPLPVPQGGTGQITAQTAIDALTAVSGASTSDVLTKDGSGNAAWVTPAASAVGAGGFQTLVVKRASVSTVDIDADHIQLKNSAGEATTVATVNLTVDITASGANGLDTGAEANAVYILWVAYNSTTTTTIGLLSLSSTLGGLTLPAGYTFARAVGQAVNSTDILDFYQKDTLSTFTSWRSIASGISATTPTAQSVASVVATDIAISVSVGVAGTLLNAVIISTAADAVSIVATLVSGTTNPGDNGALNNQPMAPLLGTTGFFYDVVSGTHSIYIKDILLDI